MTSAARVMSFTTLNTASHAFFQIGVNALEPPQAGFGIDERGANRLIDLVCKRSCQLSHRGHSADGFEIRLRLGKGLFGIDRLASSSFGRRRKMTGDQRYRQKKWPQSMLA